MKLAAVVVLLALGLTNGLDFKKLTEMTRKVALKQQDVYAQNYEALLMGRRNLQDSNACFEANPSCDTTTGPDFSTDECKAVINCLLNEVFGVLDGCFDNFGAFGAYFQCMFSLLGLDTDAFGASETIVGEPIDVSGASAPDGGESVPQLNGNGSIIATSDPENVAFLTVVQSGGTPTDEQCTTFFAADNVATYSALTCISVFENIENQDFATVPECIIADPLGQTQGIDVFAGSTESSDPETFVNNIDLDDATLTNLKAALASCDSAVPEIDIQETIEEAKQSSAVAYSAQVVSVVSALVLVITLA